MRKTPKPRIPDWEPLGEDFDETYSPAPGHTRGRSLVWNYCKKVMINGKKYAKCNYCGRTLEMKTTCTNLIRRHLEKEHHIPLRQEERSLANSQATNSHPTNSQPTNCHPTNSQPSPRDPRRITPPNHAETVNKLRVAQRDEWECSSAVESVGQGNWEECELRRNRSEVWSYAQKKWEGQRKYAQCNFCSFKLEMRNSSTNQMRRHLQKQHGVQLAQELPRTHPHRPLPPLSAEAAVRLAALAQLTYRQIADLQLITGQMPCGVLPTSPEEVAQAVGRAYEGKQLQLRELLGRREEEFGVGVGSCELMGQQYLVVVVGDSSGNCYQLPLYCGDPAKVEKMLQEWGLKAHQVKHAVCCFRETAQLQQETGWALQSCLVCMLDRAVAAALVLPACLPPQDQCVKQEAADPMQQLLLKVTSIAKTLREKGCELPGNADWEALQGEPRGWQSAHSICAAFLKLAPTLHPAIRRICPKDMPSDSELLQLSGSVRALSICVSAQKRLLRRECGASDSEAILDAAVSALKKLSCGLAGRLVKELGESYCELRQGQLVCAMLYLASQKQYHHYCSRAPFPTFAPQALEQWILNNYDDQGELAPLQTMAAEEELALWPSGSMRAELHTYATLKVKGRLLREAEKKMKAVACQSGQHGSGLDEFGRGVGGHMGRLEAQDMPKLQFLNWYYRSFGGINQVPQAAPTLTID